MQYKIKNIIILIVLPALVASFFHYRGFGRENQISEFPIIYRAMDSDYLPNDFYTNRASEFGPRYLYAKFIALISSEGSLPTIAFLIILLINIAIALITFFLARDIYKGSNLAAFLAAFIVMTVKTFDLGYLARIYANQLISSDLVVPFIFVAFWAAYRFRPYLPAFSAGIAVLIHPAFGAECGVLAFLLLLVRLVIIKVKHLGVERHVAHGVRALNKSFWTHLFTKRSRWLQTNPPRLLRSHPSQEGNAGKPHNRVLSRNPLLLDLNGGAPEGRGGLEQKKFVFLANFHEVLVKRWAAGGRWFYKLIIAIIIFLVFAAIPLIPYLSMEHIDGQQFMAIETFFRHPHHSVPSHFRIMDYVFGLIFLIIAGFSWYWANREEIMFPFITIVILLLCLSGYIFVELVPLRLMAIARPFRLLFIVKWLGLIMMAGAIARFLRTRGRKILSLLEKVKPRVVTALAFAAAGLTLLLSIVYYTPIDILPKKVVSKLQKIMPELRYKDIQTYEAEAARFVRVHTGKDAIFLTPPVFGKFRLIAKRAMVVDWKSFPFQGPAMVEWRQRLFDCYGIPASVGLEARKEMNANYKKITGPEILELQKKYGCSCAVLYNETPTEFPVIYENRRYKIIQLIKREK